MPGERMPAVPLVADDERGLSDISGAIHDLWFLLPEVRFDAEAGRVTVPLTHEEQRRGWFGIRYWTRGEEPAGTLTLDAVRSFRVVDEERIGGYNVSSLHADPEAGGAVHLTLYGGIPVELHVVADRIAVRFDPALPVTGEAVGGAS